MIKFRLISVLYFFLVSGNVSFGAPPSPPTWSPAYSASGTLYIPYAELKEPFFAWYDEDKNLSRIDYYGGMVKTYQYPKMGDFGATLKLAPMTTDDVSNVETCFRINGSTEAATTIQSILPDLTNFKLMGSEIVNGLQCEKWREVDSKWDGKVSKYTMWIRWKKSATTPRLNIAVPVRYEMRGFNSLLGSHYDHYYLDYDTFEYDRPDPQVFEIAKNTSCRGFPGPGLDHVYTFNPIKEFVDRETGHVDSAWSEFTKTHSKQYDTDSHEHLLRKDLFRQNLRFIHSTNRANLGFTVGVNHLADRSDLEMKALRGRRHTPGYNGGAPFPHSTQELIQLKDSIPENFDWRIFGAVTPVKDQSVCGSCWSFGTTGAMEGAYFVKHKELMSFSQQALIDCSWGQGNNGCDGGEDFRSYEWIMKHGGIPTMDDYGPYYGQDGYCHVETVKLHAPIDHFVNVTPSDEDAFRTALFKNGPISVAIDASPKTFTFYNNGVYYDKECKNTPEGLDHAVLAVGYGNIDGQNYWLVKNSWSNYWGNQGYILMSTKDNNCGVMTTPTYVVLK